MSSNQYEAVVSGLPEKDPTDTQSESEGPGSPITVFVSYPREEESFIACLRSTLRESSIICRGDWNFVDGEDFRSQALRMIVESDVVIFVITPVSVSSRACREELLHAVMLRKRILPVLREEATDEVYEELPKEVREIDFLHFRAFDDRSESIRRMIDFVRTDITLAQIHRRLSVRCDDWLAGYGGLAVGEELRRFLAFQIASQQQPDRLPRPSERQIDFIRASDRSERSSWRVRAMAVLLAGVAIASVGVALWLRHRSAEVIEAMSSSRGFVESTSDGLRVYFGPDVDPSRAIPFLGRLSNVSEIDLGATQLSDSMLLSVPEIDGISVLRLYKTAITDAGLTRVAAMNDLEHLDLSETAVTDVGLARLSSLFELRSLDLGGTRISDDSAEYLVRLGKLEYLSVENTEITARLLAALRGMASLRHLDLQGCSIDDEALGMLSTAKSLAVLNIGRTAISGSGFERFPQGGPLAQVWAKGSAFDDRGMQAIAGMASLRVLSVPATKVTDAGLVFASGLGLEELYLGGTKVSDRGMVQVAKVISLRKLYLPGTSITDRGLLALATLKNAEDIRVGGTSVSETGIRELRRVLPNASIGMTGPD